MRALERNIKMETQVKRHPLVTALVDLGSSWAAHGLDAGKLSLEKSAGALTRTAKTLETLARELEKKVQPPEPPPT
jgi:hypothetical protein